ncbi:MAG: DUF2306 domain-containing protein [Proteobacteria bacterium]|nr:DUF2306 domain-containing protein [Pseudomonadota bacterium]
MTSVLGIEIPSTSPLFLAVVAFHVAVGLASVVAGASAMLSKKGASRHIASGKTYYWCLAAVFVSATVLAFARWSEDKHLFVLGALAFAMATLGRSAIRQKWKNWRGLHIAGMGASYILMLTAFYVDNGKALPIWRDLPQIAYWTLPAIVGLPIMVWALVFRPATKGADG